jgi:FkbM family methyltransferase
MPSTRQEHVRTYLRTVAPWRRLMPNRSVRRHVQGVDLYLPWSHPLPDFARSCPTYGQNLVRLAVALHARAVPASGPLRMLDVGANIGDSAAQIIANTDAEVLCVEGDPYWVNYLRKNVGDNPRATIEEALLTGVDGAWDAASPVRQHGTTRFVQSGEHPSMPAISVRDLRAKHPDFDQLRLVKSDTDGFDPVLVPAVAEAWADSGPVLFFEFDPIMARGADAGDPNDVWKKLADLGYTDLAIWDNGGDPLGRLDISDALTQAASLEPRPVHLGYYFWDVAACRGTDSAAVAAFDELVPEEFSVLGTWR